MIGKVVSDNNDLKLFCQHGELPFSPDLSVEVITELKKRLDNENQIWVEFMCDTIAIGSDEFDVIDCDVANISKIYDETFGTSKENVSVATSRYERNNYPIGGFSPGFYNCKCLDCENTFVGDKRSVQCEKCALNYLIP